MPKETIVNNPITELHDFPDHPFAVRNDDAMREITESAKEYGILTPITVRPRDEGGYEIISGHRRKHACELSGIAEIPAIIRECTRDEAIIMMVDSNLQRDSILPSENGKAYKMKMEAVARRMGRPPSAQENGGQVGHTFSCKTRDLVAEGADESARNIQRYIRLMRTGQKYSILSKWRIPSLTCRNIISKTTVL